MNRIVRSIALLFVLSSALFAQNGLPIPDFGTMGDPSAQTNIRFQTYEKAPLKFSTTTTYVLVPVVVTDKDGNPVQGLKKESFRVQESGRDVAISSIEEYKSTAAALSPTKTPVNEASNEVVGGVAPRRLVIIVFDLLNTPFEDQSRARHALIKFLADSADSNSLYLLSALDSRGLHVIHDFTSDTSALMAALQKAKNGFTVANSIGTDIGNRAVTAVPVSPDTGNPDQELYALKVFAEAMGPYVADVEAHAADDTLRAFLYLTERVSGVPGRKSLVWITGGFPFSLDPSTGSIGEGYSFGVYQHVMTKLSDEMISVYPIDARGLLTYGPDATVKLPKREDTRASASQQAAADYQRDILETMRAFADMTGGRAYVNNNDTKGAIRDASRDGANYYLLSYPMDKSDKKPGYRKISVKVGDYRVRARKGYYATQIAIDRQLSAKNDIDAALTSPFDYTGLPMRLVVEQAPAGGKRKLTFTALMPPKVASIDIADSNHLNVEFAYSIKNAAGADSGHKGVTYNLKLQPAQVDALNSSGVSYGDSVEVAPGTYSVRIVARDNFTGKIGSVLKTVEVK